MTTLTVLTFGGLSILPVRAASALGLFEAAGMAIELIRVTGSGEIRDQLAGGSTQVAHLAPDNVIAWSDEGLPVRAWLAGSNGPISLLARGPDSITDLRGRRVGVDSERSGFVTILRGLLEEAEIRLAEVELVAIGATRLRYESLVDGVIDATMLTLPWTQLARRDGATDLGDHRRVAPGLLTSCAASMEAWLRNEPDLAVRYAKAVAAGTAWVRDAVHRAAVVELLMEEMRIEAQVATEVLAEMDDPAAGWPADVALTAESLLPSTRLRASTVAATKEISRYVEEIRT
jgi:ABC-type nitrate/sulfonate/bicarbonate transport system substrate-binding protein